MARCCTWLVIAVCCFTSVAGAASGSVCHVGLLLPMHLLTASRQCFRCAQALSRLLRTRELIARTLPPLVSTVGCPQRRRGRPRLGAAGRHGPGGAGDGVERLCAGQPAAACAACAGAQVCRLLCHAAPGRTWCPTGARPSAACIRREGAHFWSEKLRSRGATLTTRVVALVLLASPSSTCALCSVQAAVSRARGACAGGRGRRTAPCIASRA